MWTIKSFALFMAAAALGALARLALSLGFESMGSTALLPWAIFCANILGCFFFGMGWVYVQHRRFDARALLVGFMGSFTTFSSYAYDIYTFIVLKNWLELALYAAGHMVLALCFLHFGIVSMRKILAIKPQFPNR